MLSVSPALGLRTAHGAAPGTVLSRAQAHTIRAPGELDCPVFLPELRTQATYSTIHFSTNSTRECLSIFLFSWSGLNPTVVSDIQVKQETDTLPILEYF